MDTSKYTLFRPLPTGKTEKVFGLMKNEIDEKDIGLIKDELKGKILTKCAGLKAKFYSCLIDDGSENKKEKGTNKCFKKWCRTIKNV